MANNSASSIRTALGAKLSEVVTSGQIKQLKSGRDVDLSVGFPACRYYLVGISSEQVDNAPSDYRTYRFGIDIIQQYTAQDVATAEAAFQNAVDAVLDKLNAEFHICGNVYHSIIETSNVAYQELPQGPAVMLSIIFQAKTVIY